MNKQHHYTTDLIWTGNQGTGTTNYRAYERAFEVYIEGKPVLEGSSDPAFRGDPTRHNPEELLLASLSSCHMLWFLHYCADEGVLVTAYTDTATAIMQEDTNGSGRFTEATLRPHVTVTDEPMIARLDELHERANRSCFIANSVNFPVRHKGIGVVQAI